MKKGGGSASIIIIGPSKSVRAPQLRIRPRPGPLSGVRAKLIILYWFKVIGSKGQIKLVK